MSGNYTGAHRSELVLGFVGALGVDFAGFHAKSKTILEKEFGYASELIKLSELLDELGSEMLLTTELFAEPEHKRIRSHMDAGDELRNLQVPNARELLVSAGVARIAAKRPTDSDEESSPMPGKAWLISSLKNPAEVEALRRIYGPGFYLIGLFATRKDRKQALQKQMQAREAQALISRDEASGKVHGQQTRDTFELADAWVQSEDELRRVLNLMFGNTFETPTDDENGMALAYTAALRSSDLSRQVGVAVLSEKGEVLGTGYNEVPAPGGGQYSPPTSDRPTARDCDVGHDSNARERLAIQQEIVDGILEHLGEAGTSNQQRIKRELQEILSTTGLREITEYGRSVHAEMSALMSAVRVGAAVRGATLYCTTFPCHSCAKHIVAAGIDRVVFVEPYPKSKAISLHADAITIEGENFEEGKSEELRLQYMTASLEQSRTRFEPFLGVGPRRYFDLFSMKLGTGDEKVRKDRNGKVLEFRSRDARPRVPNVALTYLEYELLAAELLKDARSKLKSEEETS